MKDVFSTINIYGDVGTVINIYTIILPQHPTDDIPEAEIVEEEEDNKPLSFEDAIPEHLRTGRLLVAWNQLVKEGILTHDYQLGEDTSKSTAKYLVECFCLNKGRNYWTSFEQFWELKNLRCVKDLPRKEVRDAIDKIFCNL